MFTVQQVGRGQTLTRSPKQKVLELRRLLMTSRIPVTRDSNSTGLQKGVNLTSVRKARPLTLICTMVPHVLYLQARALHTTEPIRLQIF